MEVDLQFRVPASFTSLTREGFVRARRDRSWALAAGHKPGMAWVPSEHYEWSLKSTSPLETALEAPITAGHSFEYTSGPVGVGLPIETPQGVRTG